MSVSDVQAGDILRVRSGERAALDGEVISGEGNFDESSLTGESNPVYKCPSDTIISGTTSIDAILFYRASKDFAHSTYSHLVQLLEGAMSKKPHIEQLANRLSQHFSSTILFLAIATFWGWYFWPHSFDKSLMVGISVIIIACPCALALATPVATLVGLALGAKRGIVFKRAAHIETMAKATMIVLDKTGTITQGRPEVVNVEFTDNGIDMKTLYSLVGASKHPVSRGVARYIQEHDEMISQTSLEESKEIPARGVVARHNGVVVAGGNGQLMKEMGIDSTTVSDNTLFYYAVDGKLSAIFELRDTPKTKAKESIEKLKKI
jgi:Cu+-exporting ATPase